MSQVALKIIRKRAMQTAKAMQNLKQEMQVRLTPPPWPGLAGRPAASASPLLPSLTRPSLPPSLCPSPQILERLQPLHHPHLVGYVGQLEDRSGIIMILEYCPGKLPPPHVASSTSRLPSAEAMSGWLSVAGVVVVVAGGDLFDHVVKQGHYSMRDASLTARQILLGLKAMHAQGVIHRYVRATDQPLPASQPASPGHRGTGGHYRHPQSSSSIHSSRQHASWTNG